MTENIFVGKSNKGNTCLTKKNKGNPAALYQVTSRAALKIGIFMVTKQG